MKGAPAFSLSRRTASILRNVRKLPFCFFSSSNVMYCMNILPITAATQRQPHEIKQQIFLKQPTRRAQSGPCRPTGGPPSAPPKKNATQTVHRRTQVASGRHTDRPRAALEPRGLCKLWGIVALKARQVNGADHCAHHPGAHAFVVRPPRLQMIVWGQNHGQPSINISWLQHQCSPRNPRSLTQQTRCTAYRDTRFCAGAQTMH